MKAKKLLTLLPVLALAACGGAKALDQTQATERANAILAAQGEITETPSTFQVVEHAFYQDTYADGTVEEQEFTNTTTVAENYVSFRQVYHYAGGEETIDQDLSVWCYVKDAKLTLAFEVNGEGQYLQMDVPEGAEVPAEALDANVAGVMGEESVVSEFDLSFFFNSTVLEGISNLYDEEVIEAMGFTTYEITAKSTGEGNLTLAVEATMNEEMDLGEYGGVVTLTGEIKESYSWNNNLFTKYVSEMTSTATNAEGTTTTIVNDDTTVNYSVKVAYPDLSTFEQATA